MLRVTCLGTGYSQRHMKKWQQAEGWASLHQAGAHVPWDRLQCPRHACWNGIALGRTQHSSCSPCSHEGYLIAGHWLCTRIQSTRMLLWKQHHILSPFSCPACAICTRWPWLAHKSHVCCFLGRIPLLQHGKCPKMHWLWSSRSTHKAQQPRVGMWCLDSLHMPQLAQPALAPHFVLASRDPDLTESSSNIIYCRLSNSTMLAPACCVSTVPPTPAPASHRASHSQGGSGPSSQPPTTQLSSFEHPGGCSCTQESVQCIPTQ